MDGKSPFEHANLYIEEFHFIDIISHPGISLSTAGKSRSGYLAAISKALFPRRS